VEITAPPGLEVPLHVHHCDGEGSGSSRAMSPSTPVTRRSRTEEPDFDRVKAIVAEHGYELLV
jgi:hypothetical protein